MQPCLKSLAAPEQPRLHRADRDSERVGYFLVSETLDVGEYYGNAKLVRQFLDRANDMLVDQSVEHAAFGIGVVQPARSRSL